MRALALPLLALATIASSLLPNDAVAACGASTPPASASTPSNSASSSRTDEKPVKPSQTAGSEKKIEAADEWRPKCGFDFKISPGESSQEVKKTRRGP